MTPSDTHEIPSEPTQPGWYPSEDPRYQRYCAGPDQGWLDDYKIDPRLRVPRRRRRELFLIILCAELIGLGMALGLLVAMLLPI